MTMDREAAPLPPHDPLTCGLHGIDHKGNPKAYCARCIIDGDWKTDSELGVECKRKDAGARSGAFDNVVLPEGQEP